MRFDKVSGVMEGQAFSLDGSMRLDFLTAVSDVDMPASNFRMQLSFDKLSGTAAGETFGPISAIALLENDAAGETRLTLNGMQYFGLSSVDAADSRNFTIGSSRVRSAHWSDGKGYVDYEFSDWRTQGGKPLAGSTGRLSAGQDKAQVLVESSGSSEISYRVELSSGGQSGSYRVLGSYGASNSISYTVTKL